MTARPFSATGPPTSGFLNTAALPLGVQLWSVKNDLARDFDETLHQLATTGYTYAETAGYDPDARTIHGRSPELMKQQLDGCGMVPLSAHIPFFSKEEMEPVLEDVAALGASCLVIPAIPEDLRHSLDHYKRIADDLNIIGERAASLGIRLGYHNHNYEFKMINGLLPYNILLERTDKETVFFEPDLGWMVQAGQAPEALFNTFPGRFLLWHLRDVNAGGAAVNVGEGVVNFHLLHQMKKQAGFLCGIVETPSAATDGMNRVIASFNYIRKEQLY
ncbi:sugar phosphate isomerase/epimerase family protein [Niabella beijingensis]|uniref:sugar phosphate isomerase/epimerase family protein n=1 Tax=Niabella beijingensis TaxID=2872700 RepID=UPI001CBFC8EC|nr:TIM barrel protein [Niabella beijingensis]MBZ4189241.1 sugar phosphate isomerase/epimerase [Niabella beijingensis]